METPPPFVKGQITGPVSFGLTVPFEDRRAILYDDTFRDIATKLLSAKARWQADLLSRWAPASVGLIMVDEPSLTQAGSAFVSIPEAIAFPALEECLDAIDCLTGIHVCGGTDWGRVIDLPLDVLNFDAADHLDSLLSHGDAVAGFLAEGGILAWGAVPNDERAFSLTAEVVGGRMVDAAGALARLSGSDVDAVLASSFVSPACGTGSLPGGDGRALFRSGGGDVILAASPALRCYEFVSHTRGRRSRPRGASGEPARDSALASLPAHLRRHLRHRGAESDRGDVARGGRGVGPPDSRALHRSADP